MNVHIGLVRGINVGGHNQFAMADLRDLVSRLGFDDPRTLLQSGNVVFRSRTAREAGAIERLLENEAKKRLRLEVDFFIRSIDQWQAIVARNPFKSEATRDPGHLLVMFLKDAPSRANVTALRGAIQGAEVIRADGHHLYLVYPDGIGDSRLTFGLIEKKLGTRGTTRNWNTVLKLQAIAGAESTPR